MDGTKPIKCAGIEVPMTEAHEQFHEEKDALLPAAREASRYFQADDTGARHLGKNAYTTVIANGLFASFTTTQSKSRVDFLKLLWAPYEEYVLLSPAQLMHGRQRQVACRCPESQGRTSRPWHPSDHWQRGGQ